MAEVTGVIANTEQIADAKQPTGIPGSRVAFFLRPTPRIRTLIAANQPNRSFVFAAVVAVESAQIQRGSRFFKGSRPAGLTIDFESTIAGIGTLTGDFIRPLRTLAGSIGGVGAVAAGIARTRIFEATISGVGAVTTELEGGQVGTTLALAAEESAGEMLTAETGDALTLTAESADTLTLTPEN